MSTCAGPLIAPSVGATDVETDVDGATDVVGTCDEDDDAGTVLVAGD
jgi:hypothetical protein